MQPLYLEAAEPIMAHVQKSKPRRRECGRPSTPSNTMKLIILSAEPAEKEREVVVMKGIDGVEEC